MAAAAFTILPASRRLVKSFDTAATSATLPSDALPSTMTPEVRRARSLAKPRADVHCRGVDARREHAHAFHVLRSIDQSARHCSGALRLLRREFLLKSCCHFGEFIHFDQQLSIAYVQELCQAVESPLLFSVVGEGPDPRHRLDAPRPRRHAPFADGLEQADVARAPHVRAAAKLLRKPPVGDRDHADFVTVLLAKERHGAGVDRRAKFHFLGHDFLVLKHVLVHQNLDVEQVLRVERRVVREVKAQPVGRHQRPCLLDVRPERVPEGGVKQVRAGMVASDGVTTFGVDASLHGHIDAQRKPGSSFVNNES